MATGLGNPDVERKFWSPLNLGLLASTAAMQIMTRFPSMVVSQAECDVRRAPGVGATVRRMLADHLATVERPTVTMEALNELAVQRIVSHVVYHKQQKLAAAVQALPPRLPVQTSMRD